MNKGEQIYRYRKMRGLTQNELAKKIGLTEGAIRSYETGRREPSNAALEALSKALGVPEAAIGSFQINSAREALEALFRIEEEFGLTPDKEGKLFVDNKAKGAQKLTAAIKAWRRVLDDVESGKMSKEEYEDWKTSIKA